MRSESAGRLGVLLVVILPTWGILAGCDFGGGGQKLQLKYDRPAQYEIPERIRILGIAEFGGQGHQEVKWGEIASDRLASQLDAYNKQFNRYQLVDRKRLKAVLDEQDIQAAFSDSAKAVQAGKIAHVDAMIYGNVNVTARDEQITKTTVDVLNQGVKEVHRTKRYVMAAVTFTIDDVETSKTLATVSATREYDSEKTDANASKIASVTKLIGVGGSNLPASDQIISQLIDECVAEFVAKISPHQIVETETLHKGKSEAVKTANKLALTGDYAEALDLYKTAIAAHPDDHEAIFDCGVTYEAMGKLGEAEKCYDKAFKMEPQDQYLHARKRVRVENAGSAEKAPTTAASE